MHSHDRYVVALVAMQGLEEFRLDFPLAHYEDSMGSSCPVTLCQNTRIKSIKYRSIPLFSDTGVLPVKDTEEVALTLAAMAALGRSM